MTPVEIVQAQFDAYNDRDADRLASFYADDCVIADMSGTVTLQGVAAIHDRFRKTFADNPQNRAWSVNRIAVGNIVVDHEKGERSPGGDSFGIVAVYTIADGKVARLTMGR
ncbi:MAG: SnoaL-like domain-containing protein [Alphaproteobacteria bacterium]|nr:SnoaL-like domain-containing protein [Alphaproteobacteria bacterium]